MSCEDFKPLLSGYVDSELTREERDRLQNHLSHCSECRADLLQLKNLEGVTDVMKNESMPDTFWDTYWLSVYNRLERGVGWVLLSIGAIMLGGFGVYHFVNAFMMDPGVPIVVRLGVSSGALGVLVLTLSLARERIRTWKFDPYKEVKR